MNNKYRKKPIVIEAMQIPVRNSDKTEELLDYFFKLGQLSVWLGIDSSWKMADDHGIDITTLEGVMHGSQGDFIIKGVHGEMYPCKPDIFEKTYEQVVE